MFDGRTNNRSTVNENKQCCLLTAVNKSEKAYNPKVSLKSDIYSTDKSPPTHGLKRHALTIFNRKNRKNHFFFLFILIQYKQFGVYAITTCTPYNFWYYIFYEVMTFKVYIGPIIHTIRY